MAGSAISIPMLLFGEHSRAAVINTVKKHSTVLSPFQRRLFFVSAFLLANLHPRITTLLKCSTVTQKKACSPVIAQ